MRKIAACFYLSLALGISAGAQAQEQDEIITLRMPQPRVIKPASAVTKTKSTAPKPEAAKPGEITHAQSFGSWRMFCVTARKPMPCEMVQETTLEGAGKRVIKLTIGYVPSRNTYAVEIAVPLGVLIQKGLILKSQTYSSGQMAYRNCSADFCFMNGEIDGAGLGALASEPSGKVAVLVWNEDEKPMNMMLSLSGFAETTYAMTNLAKAAFAARAY